MVKKKPFHEKIGGQKQSISPSRGYKKLRNKFPEKNSSLVSFTANSSI